MLGALVGDALGVPYEFHDAADIPARPEMEPPPGFRRAHPGVLPGTWSDDGAQLLCLLGSLLERDRLDPDDLGRRIVGWYQHGSMAVGGAVFDVGIQTGQAIRALEHGTPALEAGPSGERDNGNGSLMRVLPLGLWHRGTDAELARDAALQSRVTHGHARSRVACGLYSLWARHTLHGSGDAWAEATRALRATLAVPSAEHEALEDHLRPDDPAPGRGSGYVVDSLRSARACVEGRGFEDAVVAAIRLGDDTDTTACLVGGVCGARDGVSAIPARWLGALRGRELCDPLVAALVRSRG